MKDVCNDFNFGQSVQLSSTQKFDLKREPLGARCDALSGSGERSERSERSAVKVIFVRKKCGSRNSKFI